jgi:hypothetical protein
VRYQHTSPAKGEVATPRNRKRHYDVIILSLFMVFHNLKFQRMQGVMAAVPHAIAYAFFVRAYLAFGNLPTKFERSGEHEHF